MSLSGLVFLIGGRNILWIEVFDERSAGNQKRIRSISSTHKLTSAMKLIAAAQLRQSHRGLLWARNYENSLLQMFENVVNSLDADQRQNLRNKLPWFFHSKDLTKPHIICVLGANKGLCGGYNLFVVHEALSEEKRHSQQVATFIPLTPKTSEYFLKHKANQTEPLAGLGHFSKGDHFLEKARYVLEHMERWFKNHEAGSVGLVSGRFVNTLTQTAGTTSVFPFWEDLESRLTHKGKRDSVQQPLLEPCFDQWLSQILRHLLLLRLYRAFVESEACIFFPLPLRIV